VLFNKKHVPVRINYQDSDRTCIYRVFFRVLAEKVITETSISISYYLSAYLKIMQQGTTSDCYTFALAQDRCVIHVFLRRGLNYETS
jgi:hypothetical protein